MIVMGFGEVIGHWEGYKERLTKNANYFRISIFSD
jgi:hypothetical protein